jgi:hypothetical protein
MIVIAGDSWGEGQWRDNSKGPNSIWPGFHHYWIQSGEAAVNISFGGLSNYQIIDSLDYHFANQTLNRRAVIVWLTCVLRDYPKGLITHDIDSWTSEHYQTIFNRLIYLGHQYQTKIYILGGLGDIPRSFDSKLSTTVTILAHSTAKLINPHYEFESPSGHFTLIENVSPISQRHKIYQRLENKFNYMQSNLNIYHDGCHFGCKSYQTIFNYVQSKI